MSDTTKPTSPPATWTQNGVSEAQFDAYHQVATLRFTREGGGGQLTNDHRQLGQLLTHFRAVLMDLPELKHLKLIRDELDKLPPETRRVGGPMMQWMEEPHSGAPTQRTIDFAKREELTAQLKLASAAAVERIARRVGLYLHGRSAREIGAAILVKIGPELEELAQRGLAARLLSLAGGTTKDLAAKVLDQLVQ